MRLYKVQAAPSRAAMTQSAQSAPSRVPDSSPEERNGWTDDNYAQSGVYIGKVTRDVPLDQLPTAAPAPLNSTEQIQTTLAGNFIAPYLGDRAVNVVREKPTYDGEDPIIGASSKAGGTGFIGKEEPTAAMKQWMQDMAAKQLDASTHDNAPNSAFILNVPQATLGAVAETSAEGIMIFNNEENSSEASESESSSHSARSSSEKSRSENSRLEMHSYKRHRSRKADSEESGAISKHSLNKHEHHSANHKHSRHKHR